MLTYKQLVARAQKAKAAAVVAADRSRMADRAIKTWGRERFIAALARRRIVINKTLIVYPGKNGTCSSAAIPVAETKICFISDVSSPGFGNGGKWWFTLFVARAKKRGGFRNELLYMAAYGATPEKAAEMVKPWPIVTPSPALRRAHDALPRRKPDAVSDPDRDQMVSKMAKEIGP